jgi:hypothetical protein
LPNFFFSKQHFKHKLNQELPQSAIP